MQRRNFRLPGKGPQRGQIGGGGLRGTQPREIDRRPKGDRPGRQAPEKSTVSDRDVRPKPDEEGRWQDDGGAK